MMATPTIHRRRIGRFLGLAALAVATSACGDVVRDGRSPVFLVIDSLRAAPTGGFGANTFQSNLFSDVQVLITDPAPCTTASPCPTTFSDSGQVTLRIALKDIGTAAAPTAPTSNNEVTITRVRVAYRRTDGRNVPGIDVPYGFDVGSTATIPAGGTATVGFELVRHVAKAESPLVQLISNPNVIAAIADVTFYGKDRVGNEITVTGSISIEFGNFGDG